MHIPCCAHKLFPCDVNLWENVATNMEKDLDFTDNIFRIMKRKVDEVDVFLRFFISKSQVFLKYAAGCITDYDIYSIFNMISPRPC